MLISFDVPEDKVAAVAAAVANVLNPTAPPGIRAGDLGWGFDPFGTPYESAADRERGENLVQWGKENDARSVVLQPGMLDMSTYNAEDLMFAGTFMGEIGPLLQGPRVLEKAFNNWWHDGTSPLPELPVTAEIMERRFQPYDWTTYQGPVRKLIPRLN